ncbi:hypothetical protein MKEN_00593300 [Mycena kentingensis (nom. inval.)]|nr:hypothetical protein MKEN_00593300 [Mycena kentingensis (nom. inval.)]
MLSTALTLLATLSLAAAAPLPRAEALSAATLLSNAQLAQKLNGQYQTLSLGDACPTENETACISSNLAKCVSGKWQPTACPSSLQCLAVPSLRTPGAVVVDCTSEKNALSSMKAAGVDGLVAQKEDVQADAGTAQKADEDDEEKDKNDDEEEDTCDTDSESGDDADDDEDTCDTDSEDDGDDDDDDDTCDTDSESDDDQDKDESSSSPSSTSKGVSSDDDEPKTVTVKATTTVFVTPTAAAAPLLPLFRRVLLRCRPIPHRHNHPRRHYLRNHDRLPGGSEQHHLRGQGERGWPKGDKPIIELTAPAAAAAAPTGNNAVAAAAADEVVGAPRLSTLRPAPAATPTAAPVPAFVFGDE